MVTATHNFGWVKKNVYNKILIKAYANLENSIHISLTNVFIIWATKKKIKNAYRRL